MSLLNKQISAFARHRFVLPAISRDDDFGVMKTYLEQLLPGAKVEIWVFGSQKIAPTFQLEIIGKMIPMIREKLANAKAIRAFLVHFGASDADFNIPVRWAYIYEPDEATPERIKSIRESLHKECVSLGGD